MSKENETPSPAAPPPPAAAEQETPGKRTSERGAAAARTEAKSMSLGAKLAVALFYTVIGLGVAVYMGAGPYLRENWLMLAGAVLALLVTLSLVSTRRWFVKAKAQQRMGAIILAAVLVILAFFVVVFLVETKFQAAVLRLIFLLIVCCLPAVMYYLFIATKKNSLLNELTINLGRLGLLDPARVPVELRVAGLDGENARERENRIQTYVQKFESVYGSVPTNLGGFLLKPTDPGQSNAVRRPGKVDATGFTNFTFDTVLPVLLATLLIALGWLITLPPWEGRFMLWSQGEAVAVSAAAESVTASTVANDKLALVFTPVKSPERFAFIGAYFFALQLLFRRYVRRDLRASAYVAVSLRIILAVLGVWVLAAAMELLPAGSVGAKDSARFANTLLVGAFIVGVFPRVLWQVLQAALKKRVGWLLAPNLQTQLPISDLDGLTVWHEARFEEEDIENIPNMATADIVDMMINTRFPPDRIIDWVDQAILYTHLGQEGKSGPARRDLLRAHGIRTASALVEAYNRSAQHHDRPQFEQILPGDGRQRLRSLVDAVGTNPNLKLIQTWRGLLPHTHEEASAREARRGQEANGEREEAEETRAAEEPGGGGGANAEEGVMFPAELQSGNGK